MPSLPLESAYPSSASELSEEADGRRRAAEVACLFTQHNRLLVRFLRARLGSEQDAKEVAQEAYVKVLQLDRTGAVGFLRAYLFKVAANLAIDRLRQRVRLNGHENIDLFEDLADTAEPERCTIAAEQLSILAKAIDELPPKCRQAFLLYRVQDRTQPEIAAEIGMSERMVRNYLVYAMYYCKLRVEGVSAEQARRTCR